MIEIYTDGACSGNGSENSYGAFAVVVYMEKLTRLFIQILLTPLILF